jgi:hypothetical protein
LIVKVIKAVIVAKSGVGAIAKRLKGNIRKYDGGGSVTEKMLSVDA